MSDTKIPDHLDGLVDTYLQHLLRNERQAACKLIMDTVDSGVSVRDIYLKIFQESQYEIGRLWESNRINVAQEHYCTAATQLIMSLLYPRIFSSEKNGKRLIATCIGGELHEIGIRMVADFFEMDGWDTWYFGANTPAQSILEHLAEVQPEILAISASMSFNVGAVKKLIEMVSEAGLSHKVKIMVGGQPFNTDPDLWQAVNADAYASNPEQAVEVADTLLQTEV